VEDRTLAAETLAFAMRTFAGFQANATVIEGEGLLTVAGTSRFPTPYSNAALPLGGDSPERVLDLARARLADRRHFLWAPAGAAGAGLARAAGYVPVGEVPALVLDAPPAPRESALRVEVLHEAEGLGAFLGVAAAAYAEAGLPARILPTLFARAARVVEESRVAVAWDGEEPIATALALLDPTTVQAGIYWVGTAPHARRRGAADAVTRRVARDAFERGARAVVLEASAAGEPVYRAMGFRDLARWERLLSPPPGE